MYCIHCGAAVEPHASICRGCGHPSVDLPAGPGVAVPVAAAPRRGRIFAIAVLGVTAAVAGGAGAWIARHLPLRVEVRPGAAVSNLTPKALAASAMPSVLTLVCLGPDGPIAQGSGFIIDSNGTAVTNWHVLSAATSSIKVTTSDDGDFTLLDVVAFDPDSDLALFRFGTRDASGAAVRPGRVRALGLGSSLDAAQGDRVMAAGAPEGLASTISDGLIAAIRGLRGRRYLQLTVPVSHGSSGGPVLNAEGKAIGVIVGGIEAGQNLNFAIPIEEVQALLNRRPPQEPKDDGGATALAQAAAAAFHSGEAKRAAELWSAGLLVRPDRGGLALLAGAAWMPSDPARAEYYLRYFLSHATAGDQGIPLAQQMLAKAIANPMVVPPTAVSYRLDGKMGDVPAHLTLNVAADLTASGTLRIDHDLVTGGPSELNIKAAPFMPGPIELQAPPYFFRGTFLPPGDFSGSYFIQGLNKSGTFEFSGR